MLREARAVADPGYVRADIFHSGFPCQPFSKMSRRDRKPCDHPLYKEFEVVCAYINKTEPKACLLENVNSFVLELEIENKSDSDSDDKAARQSHSDTGMSGISLLWQAIGMKYHIAHTTIDTKCWIDIRRPRVFIWCLHKECGSEADCAAAATLATEIQSARQSLDPEVVERHLLDLCSESGRAVHKALIVREHSKCSVGSTEHIEQKRAWEKDVVLVRKWIKDAGRPWADEAPMRRFQCRGLAGTERQYNVLEAVLMAHCHLNNLDPRSDEDLRLAKQGLKWDVSQNVCYNQAKHLRHCQASCVCTGALLYCFEADRLVHPGELLSCFGWPRHVNYESISWHKLTDLVGESQALQAIGAATLAMLRAFTRPCGW